MSTRENQAHALAMIRRGRYDIRPELLLFVAEQEDRHFPCLFQYGCNYMSKRFERAEMLVSEDVLQLAVVDALTIMQTRKPAYTVAQRAIELGMRAELYGVVRKPTLQLFKQRYQEGAADFEKVMIGAIGFGAIRWGHTTFQSYVEQSAPAMDPGLAGTYAASWYS